MFQACLDVKYLEVLEIEIAAFVVVHVDERFACKIEDICADLIHFMDEISQVRDLVTKEKIIKNKQFTSITRKVLIFKTIKPMPIDIC